MKPLSYAVTLALVLATGWACAYRDPSVPMHKPDEPDSCLSACLMQRGAMERVCVATCRAKPVAP